MTDADYADDIALLANTPIQAISRLHSLEQAAGGINLHVNANKTENMCFKREGAIFTLNGGPLKLVDKFTHFVRNASFTESDVNMHLAKAWAAIDRLSII